MLVVLPIDQGQILVSLSPVMHNVYVVIDDRSKNSVLLEIMTGLYFLVLWSACFFHIDMSG